MDDSIVRKKCSGHHEIRTGKNGDRPTGMLARVGKGADIAVSFVLMCDDQQVGAMDGSLNYIVTMRIFDGFQGVNHSEIFLELIEQEARKNHERTKEEKNTCNHRLPNLP